MTMLWRPNGSLNIATDPCDLPEEKSNGQIYSEAMQRCKNLRLDQKGVIKTRDGSSKINTTPIDQRQITRIIEQSGDRYTFCGEQTIYYAMLDWEVDDDLVDDTVTQFTKTREDYNHIYDWELKYLQGDTETIDDPTHGMWWGRIYKNETEIEDEVSAEEWSGIIYSPYNSTTDSIYCLNGVDRKRIEGSTVYEWGIEAPTAAPSLTSTTDTSVVLLLHMDGNDGENTFTDSGVTTHIVTAHGNANTDTDRYKFSTAGGLFDGTGDYLTIPDHANFDLSDGIWTIDFWYYPTSKVDDRTIYYQGTDASNYAEIYQSVMGSEPNTYLRIKFHFYNAGTAWISLSGPLTGISLNAWHHVAVCENGGLFYLFVDGILVDSDWTSYRLGNYTGTVYIGGDTSNGIVGSLDEFRILKGQAAWTTDFTPPTAAYTNAIPGLTGSYNIKYTYCRKEDTTVVCESNPSPASPTPVTCASNYLSAGWTASDDDQVTHVRIYRTLADGLDYYHDQDIAIGTTSKTITTADSALGSMVEEDHDRPPAGTFVAGPNYNGYIFVIHNNNLYFSKAKQPDYFPTAYYVEVSEPQFPGKCLVLYNGQPYYLSQKEIYLIQGTGYESFFPIPQRAITGTQSRNGAIAIPGTGIFHVGSDGIYLFSGSDRKISQGDFDPIFRGETVNGVPGITSLTNCWIIQFKNKVYFGYTSSGYYYPSNIICFNTESNRCSYYSYGREIRAVCVDEYNDRLLAGDNSGYVWELENKDETTDDSTAISWEVETKNFVLQTRAHFPRWVKYDVDALSATTAQGEIILDGESHQTHTLSEERNTRKRLVAIGNGRRCSFKISGTGPIKIYALESE